MEENVKNQLDAISNAIDSKIEKSNSQVMADVTNNASEIIKGEVSGLVQNLTSVWMQWKLQTKSNSAKKANVF
jgi:hypothetical protein